MRKLANPSNRTTIYLDEEVKKQLKILCIQKGCTLAGFIQTAVLEKMQREGKQVVKQ